MVIEKKNVEEVSGCGKVMRTIRASGRGKEDIISPPHETDHACGLLKGNPC